MVHSDINQLLAQFLRDRAAAWQAGTATNALAEAGDVVPFQQAALHFVEPAAAFHEAVEAAGHLLNQKDAAAFQGNALKSPADWSSMVRGQEAVFAIPFCLGNFPQMLREIAPLLTGQTLSELRQKGRASVRASERESGSGHSLADQLFEAACLRLARQFDAAAELLKTVRNTVPASWEGLLLNEEAALAWQRGHCDLAGRLWAKHPQADSPAVLFNRGMAALFADQAKDAAPLLRRAASAIRESSPWHHLAHLYLTLAESA